MYTKLVSTLLFPLHERLKHHDSVAVRRGLEQSQWWSPERLRDLQLQRLRSLLAEVGSQVPYYRDLFDRLSFDPRSVQSLEDLQDRKSTRLNSSHGKLSRMPSSA